MKKLTKKNKRDIMRLAKRIYINYYAGRYGMCYAIDTAINSFFCNKGLDPRDYPLSVIAYESVYEWFPEFRADLLGADFEVGSDLNSLRLHFWWPKADKDVRIKAFNKLIKCYM